MKDPSFEPLAHYFIEGVKYTAADLMTARLMAVSDRDAADASRPAQAIIDALCAYRFVSSPGAKGSMALSRTDDGCYRFNFVGIIMVRDCVFYVFLKFVTPDIDGKFVAPDDTARARMAMLVSVCERYRRRVGLGTMDVDGAIDPTAPARESMADLYRALLVDYLRDGTYHARKRTWTRDGTGEIDWERTMGCTDPLVNENGEPAYASTWTRQRAVDDEAIVKRIQQAYVAQGAQWFDRARMLTDVLRLPRQLCDISRQAPADIMDRARMRATLARARHQEFSTRNRRLIDLLLALTDQQPFGTLEQHHAVTHLGTAPFAHVWEDICQDLFAINARRMRAMHERSRPTWSMDARLFGLDGSTTVRIDTPNPLRTDVICELEDGTIGVMDAKYYVPSFTRSVDHMGVVSCRIDGQPAQPALIKECLYQLLAETSYAGHGRTVRFNAFLLPTPGTIRDKSVEPYAHVRGSIELDFLTPISLHNTWHPGDRKTGFLPILYCQIDPWAAFSAYTGLFLGDNGTFDKDAAIRALLNGA